MKVIGIQSVERREQYLRAKSWGAIIRLLQLMDPDVRDAAERAAEAILSKLDPQGGQSTPVRCADLGPHATHPMGVTRGLGP